MSTPTNVKFEFLQISKLSNLKLIDNCQEIWLTRLKFDIDLTFYVIFSDKNAQK